MRRAWGWCIAIPSSETSPRASGLRLAVSTEQLTNSQFWLSATAFHVALSSCRFQVCSLPPSLCPRALKLRRPSAAHYDHPAIRVQDKVVQSLWPKSPASRLLLARKPSTHLTGKTLTLRKIAHWFLAPADTYFRKSCSFGPLKLAGLCF